MTSFQPEFVSADTHSLCLCAFLFPPSEKAERAEKAAAKKAAAAAAKAAQSDAAPKQEL